MDQDLTRRQVLRTLAAVSACAAAGVTPARAEGVDEAAIERAEWVSGLSFTPEERALMKKGVAEWRAFVGVINGTDVPNDVPPSFRFDPYDAIGGPTAAGAHPEPTGALATEPERKRPASDDALAFSSLAELSALLRARKISSTELTRICIERIERYDPSLRCVITKTADRAIEAATRADREIGSGHSRGPLHGIPWGAKDLIAVAGYPTTWGAAPFRDQRIETTASVVERLDAAGAVLVAKTSVGALAWGDVWFDATTKNPWNPEQGSSGSSAGSASGTAAGLFGFSLGTETWGSIVSPATRCGASGLRPTFGRVSRHGVMALSWTMDKIGPICRSAADCALVFDAIHGKDPRDPSSRDARFAWPPRDGRPIRVGFVPELFEEDRGAAVPDDAGTPDEVARERAERREWAAFDRETLDALGGMGHDLVPVSLPAGVPIDPLQIILSVEAAAAFDELTRSGRDDLLVRQIENAWPNVFRVARLIPAVAYVQASRLRTLLSRAFETALGSLDALVVPTFGGNQLLATNLTGHPAVVVPNGHRAGDGTPTSITFVGRLDGERDLLALADAYQRETGHHLERPPFDG